MNQFVNTIPPLPLTGYSNPRCYANLLHDCSTSTTAEHVISESVLELVFPDAKQIEQYGGSWNPPGESRKMSIKNMSAKVLCSRHNQALSGLDDIGRKFFEFLRSDLPGNRILMINGYELERWMLKVLCGFLASGWGPHKQGTWTAPRNWLEILFGSDIVPFPGGLSLLRGKDIRAPNNQIGVFPAESDMLGSFNGIAFIIGGIHFLFFMGPPQRNIPLNVFKSGWQIRYRPTCLLMIGASGQHEIHFGAPPWGGIVKIMVTA